MATSSCLPLREATSSESLLGEGHLLLRRPHQKGLLRGFSQNVLLSERPLLCAFSSEKASSSSASSFFLLRRNLVRKDSSQPRFLFRTFQGSLISEACPREALPSRKISSIEGFLLRNTSIDAQYSDFFLCVCVTFCSYFFASIFYFLSDNLFTYISLSRQ